MKPIRSISKAIIPVALLVFVALSFSLHRANAQANTGLKSGILTKAKRDSLIQAYRQIRKQLGRFQRIDEYTDHKDRPIRFSIVKVDVPNWAFGEANLGYERKIGHHATVLLHAAYHGKTFPSDTADNGGVKEIGKAIFYPGQHTDQDFTIHARTFKLVPEVRAYVGRNAPRGFFIGAYYYYRRIDWQAEYAFNEGGVPGIAKGSSRSTVHGPGAVLGFQSIVLSRVSLGFEIGIAAKLGQTSSFSLLSPEPTGKNDPGFAPVPIKVLPMVLRLNFQVGYCFGR